MPADGLDACRIKQGNGRVRAGGGASMVCHRKLASVYWARHLDALVFVVNWQREWLCD